MNSYQNVIVSSTVSKQIAKRLKAECVKSPICETQKSFAQLQTSSSVRSLISQDFLSAPSRAGVVFSSAMKPKAVSHAPPWHPQSSSFCRRRHGPGHKQPISSGERKGCAQSTTLSLQHVQIFPKAFEMFAQSLVFLQLDHQQLNVIKYNQPGKVTLILPLILTIAQNEHENSISVLSTIQYFGSLRTYYTAHVLVLLSITQSAA